MLGYLYLTVSVSLQGPVQGPVLVEGLVSISFESVKIQVSPVSELKSGRDT